MKMNMLPRRRMIHSKIWVSDQFIKLTPLGRLLYIGLISLADDYGRFRADKCFMKAQIFAYDKVGVAKVKKLRDELEESGLIQLYEVEKTIYGFHPNWERYQTFRSDRARFSEIPAPMATNPIPADNQVSTKEKISEEKEIEEKIGEARAAIDARSLMLSGMPNTGKDTQFYRKKHPPAD